MNTEPLVILLNRALPYNCFGKVTGWSGVEYGQSNFEEAFGAHVCRMPLSQWRACKDDVTRGSVRRASQWEVDFETVEAPAGGADVTGKIRDANADQLDAIVAGLSPIVQVVYARAKAVHGRQRQPKECSPTSNSGNASNNTGTNNAPRHTAESLAAVTNYRALLKLARDAGVEDPDGLDNTQALREAILAKQG